MKTIQEHDVVTPTNNNILILGDFYTVVHIYPDNENCIVETQGGFTIDVPLSHLEKTNTRNITP
jgi:hypothetical protein